VLKWSKVLPSYEQLLAKEKLINSYINSILDLLYQTSYGEHNNLVYPDLTLSGKNTFLQGAD
jgi:hypothetical protein